MKNNTHTFTNHPEEETSCTNNEMHSMIKELFLLKQENDILLQHINTRQSEYSLIKND